MDPDLTSSQQAVQSLREAVSGLIAVYAFGSAGTPYMRQDSDLDFAFLSGDLEDPVRTWELAQAIAAAVGRDVDLVDLRRTSTVMAAHIVSEGSRLYCADQDRCAEFEARALSDYARLNEERRGILQDIRARGSVHA